MTNAILENQLYSSTRHDQNIYASLARRISVAREKQNLYLLELLDQEQQQLSSKNTSSLLTEISHQFSHWLNQPALSVAEVTGAAGGKIWRGSNSITKEVRYAESESDMIDWLELVG